MTQCKMSGRGRGWTPAYEESVCAMRRPGSVTKTGNANIDCIITTIDSIVLNEDDDNIPEIIKKSFVCQLKTLVEANENIDKFVGEIVDRCLKDKLFCLKSVVFFENAINTGGIGTKLRTALLVELQNVFEELQALKSPSGPRFMNAATLHAAVFRRVNLSTGLPIAVLVDPLMWYFKVLLNGDLQEEVELLTTLLASVGKKILKVKEQPVTLDFSLPVRMKIACGDVDKTARYWLLLCLDIINFNFEELPVPIKEFYNQHISVGFIKQVSLRVHSQVALPVKDSERTHSQNDLHATVVATKSNSPEETIEELEGSKHLGKHGKYVPPWARKNKIVTNSVQERFHKNKDITWNHHDDRFEKEDGFYKKEPPRSEMKKLSMKQIGKDSDSEAQQDKRNKSNSKSLKERHSNPGTSPYYSEPSYEVEESWD